MALQLTYARPAQAPLEVEGITPEKVAGLDLAAIAELPVHHGNRVERLGDFFDIAGDADENAIHWSGDLRGVHWIGAKMQSGRMVIHGPAGRHVGSEMAGGAIEVQGDVGDWVGAELQGGLIQVQGSAGHLAGAAYRGSARGMTGGTLLIHGAAGNEVAHSMRRGFIAVGGAIGDLAAFNMLAGTLLVFGDCGIRHAAGMRRGTLALLGPGPVELLPTFRLAGPADPAVLRLLLRELRRHDFPLPENLPLDAVQLHHGDMLEGGRGEVFVRVPA